MSYHLYPRDLERYLIQNGEPDAWDEHNMGPTGPMKINPQFHDTYKQTFIYFVWNPMSTMKKHFTSA